MTLKPFDKVLVRDEDETNWKIDLFPHYNPDSEWLYECLETEWKQCVPYEGNEHLHNTCKKLKVDRVKSAEASVHLPGADDRLRRGLGSCP